MRSAEPLAVLPGAGAAAAGRIRVFVGAVHTHRLMFEVLRWSIRRHTRRPVEVASLGALAAGASGGRPPLPQPQRPENWPVTPFSFQRFWVPMFAGWQGRTIHLDGDPLVLRAIAELNDRPMRWVKLPRREERGPDGRTDRRASSLMLLCCDRLRAWAHERIAADRDAGRTSDESLMKLKIVRPERRFPRHWNAYDPHEPGRSHEGPWFEALFSGRDADEVSREAVDETIGSGYARPSPAWQVTERASDSSRVPHGLRAADEAFLAHCRAHRFNNPDGDYRAT